MGGFAGCFNGKVVSDDSSQESFTLGVVFEATPGFILSVEVTSNYSGSVWVEEVRYFRGVVDMWWRVKTENAERARIERDFDTRYISGR